MHTRHIGSIGPILAGAALLAACAGRPDPEMASPTHMYAHYEQVGEIRSAVVAGDIDATRGPARWLASHKGDQFQADAEPALEKMRAEGRVILAQHEVTDIARSVGRMGAACGTCHQVTHGGPRVTVGNPPSASTAPAEHMSRHAWAMDRLWDGLVGPSDGAWTAGAAALSGASLDFGTGPVPPQADQLAEKVHELGRAARDARDETARAEVYGQLLQTCALCHSVLEMHTH